MSFNSFEYLIFLPVVVIVYYAIPKTRWRNGWLLVASYFFYMNWNASYAILLLAATTVTYVGALLMSRGRKKLWLIVCLTINLGILFCFKYFMIWNVVLPVGISFYTLQSVGYLIDVYRGDIEAEKNPVVYALFVSFFPQLVAGPIERSKNLLGQFKQEPKGPKYENFQKGILWIMYGLMLKLVIADGLALIVDEIYDATEVYTGWYIVVATILFSIQIYCDFYGYSTIARGSASLLGIELMSNFEAPFYSKSVQEFWRRWHISLSSWFKDYMYIPMGGNRQGKKRKCINLLIVFGVSGLWHGAAWSFVIWGLLNGAYQVVGNFKHKKEARLFSEKLLMTIATFILFAFSMLFFRAGSTPESIETLSHMIQGLGNWTIIFTIPSMLKAGVVPAILLL